MAQRDMTVLGLDLAGSERRVSGLAVLRGGEIQTDELYSHAEIMAAIGAARTRLVAIDAPLSLPAGRHCVAENCPCPKNVHFRQCDRALRRMGIPFFTITMGPMRALTRRGLKLKGELEALGIRVIETYPGAAQDLWGIPRQKDVRGLREGLRRVLRAWGLKADLRGRSVHELDAVTCVLVGWLYRKRRCRSLGDPVEGLMILPGEER